MVCKPEMDEEEEAFCVIRDFSGTSQNLKVTLHVPSTMTSKEFIQEVAKRFNFEPSSFRLVSPTPNKLNSSYQAILTEESEELLKDVGVTFEANARNLFIVEGLCSGCPRLMNRDDDLELGASASPEEPSSSNSYSPPLPPPMLIQDNVQDEVSLRGPEHRRCRKNIKAILPNSEFRATDSFYAPGYRGLVNQAMTCYLNSLLQALFMTPEFRNALYNWKFVPSSDTDESKSIPYQLQRLFLNLQTSPRSAVETTDLTRSFGWDSSEAWQQHDIQELCRVMFDALEQEFKGTEQADLINRLYQGKMIDYVRCLECSTEKSREDMFLDIPLPVRPFGSTTAYGSVEEALTAFVQPEVLEGNNQYFCEKCNRKCNAHKGLKFVKFPYLLTLHLMRFDFDYNTMHRIKLSDKVSFPETLNLNSFIPLVNLNTSNIYKEDGSEGFPEEITGSSSKCDDSSTTDSGSAIDDESCMISSNDLNNVDYDQDIDEGIDVSNQHENETKNRCGTETGPYIYELFAIMVHSGSASGGHYYVYIKDLNTGNWVCFNDQTVTRITNEDIDRSFGGYGGPSRGYYSGVYSSSMNAYMLMYRQIDRERNVLPLKEHEFPPHITALLKEMNEKAETDGKMRETEEEVHKIKVYVNHPSLNKKIDSKIEYNSSTTLKELTQIAYKKLQLEQSVSLDQCRLVLYNEQSNLIEYSLEGKENERMDSVLPLRKNVMLMEIRQPNVSFPVLKPGAFRVELYSVNLESECVQGPFSMRVNYSKLLREFRDEICDLEPFRCYNSCVMLLVLELKCNAEKFLEDETMSLQNAGVTENSQMFVSFIQSDASITKYRQKMRSIVKRFRNIIKLNIVLPDIKPEVFKRLMIPTLAEYYQYDNKKPKDDNSQIEEDSNLMNGESSAALSYFPVANSVPSASNDDSSTALSNDFMNLLTTKDDYMTSNQSASEDSSLTDSDRTIIGDNQEDYQISSPNSSPQNYGLRYLNMDENNVENNNEGTSKVTPISDDSSNDVQYNNHYFKELSKSVAFDKKSINVEVSKWISINAFKTHLEPYVQVPSPFFKIYTDSFTNGGDNVIVTSLIFLENNSTLHVRLKYPVRPGFDRCRIYLLNLNSLNHVIRYLGKFNVNENHTIGETKREILQDLSVIHNINIPFERCRLRTKCPNDGPTKVCLNEKTWKELNIDYIPELIIQELSADEPTTNSEARYCVMVRNYCPSKSIASTVREIVFNHEFTMLELKTKISEMSTIPIENIVLADQFWTNAIHVDTGSFNVYVDNSDMDWTTISDSSSPDEIIRSLTEEGRIIYYKDNRDDTTELKNARTRRRYAPRREKNLTIRVNKQNYATECTARENSNDTCVNKPKVTSGSDEGQSSEMICSSVEQVPQ